MEQVRPPRSTPAALRRPDPLAIVRLTITILLGAIFLLTGVRRLHAQVETLVVPVAADTYVSAADPTKNFDTDRVLRVDGDSIRISFLRFVVAGVNGRAVEGARLRLQAADSASITGGTVHLIGSNAWNASTMTFRSGAPAIDGPALDTLGPVANGQIVELDLGGAIAGDGTYSLALEMTPSKGAYYHSSAASSGRHPELVLMLAAGPEPALRIDAPLDGGTFEEGGAITLRATATDVEDGDLGALVVWESDVAGLLGTGAEIAALLARGTHAITATVTDGDGFEATATVTIDVVEPPPPTSTVTFGSAGDSHVHENSPTQTFLDGVLRADVSSERISYLRFVVAGTAGRPVLDARLRLQVSRGSAVGGVLHAVTDASRDPTTITYRTRPALGPPLDTLGAVADGAIVEFDVTGTVIGDGPYGFAIDSFSTEGIYYHSSRSSSGRAPELVLTLVEERGPRVDILAPGGSATFLEGDVITLQGAAADAEDGDLSASIAWSSSLDGALGTGASLATTLGLGTHTIVAAATDADANTGSDRITLTIVAPPPPAPENTPPTVAITMPADGTTVTVGAAVALAATATDLEDGTLTAAIRWSSSLDGPLGTGGSVGATLSAGPHDITATVIDGGGLQATASISVDVVADSAPTETLVLAADADTYVQEKYPDDSFGHDTILRVDVSSERTAYLRFVVAGLGARAVLAARLRLRVVQGSDSGGVLHRISQNAWDPATMTYRTRPPVDGPALDAPGSVSAGQIVEFDLGGTVDGDGIFSFAIVSPSTAGVYYDSSRTLDGQAPELVLTVHAGPEPRLAILQPLATTFFDGDLVTFQGAATDAQDGDLGAAIVWTSDLDGALGTGALVQRALGLGTHRVTAAVTDSDAHTDAAQITVTVVEPPAPNTEPLVAITAPTATTFVQGESIAFAATASDLEDGNLSASVQWTSSRSGPFGTGGSLSTATLAPGEHTITATVVDSGSLVGTAQRTLTIEPGGVASLPGTPDSPSGFQDFSFGSGVDANGNRATASKPESKLWHHDHMWWAMLYNPSGGGGHRIHALDPFTQTWINTGVLVDARGGSRQDVLWTGTKLYVLSRDGGDADNRLLRFSYDPGAVTYTLDPGFPVGIPSHQSEAMTLARDSTGRLWVAYTSSSRVRVTHTTGSDTQWASPFIVPVSGTSVGGDDIAAVQALPGKIGVFWSNQSDDAFYFAVHRDGDPPSTWSRETAAQGGSVADDHFNLKTASDGRLFAAVKTSKTGSSATLVGLLVRSASGSWSTLHQVTQASYDPTRPMCALDEGGGKVYVFYSPGKSAIYYKVSDMNAIAFPGGKGTRFMESSSAEINNPTSTKQRVDGATGLVVVASTPDSRRYWHNSFGLP
jgi:hypothetical protein